MVSINGRFTCTYNLLFNSLLKHKHNVELKLNGRTKNILQELTAQTIQCLGCGFMAQFYKYSAITHNSNNIRNNRNMKIQL